MKKIFKNPILMFIFGALIFGSIGVLATVAATSITYEPSWTKINGDPITNVSEAIDTLYTKATSNECTKGIYHHDGNSNQWNIPLDFRPTFFIVTTYVSEANLYLAYYYNYNLDGHVHQNYKTSAGAKMTVGNNFYDSVFEINNNGLVYNGESDWAEVVNSTDVYYIACR